jgi:spermidine/putrescine-binding protein
MATSEYDRLHFSEFEPLMGKRETPDQNPGSVSSLERAMMTRLDLFKRGGLTALVLAGPAVLAACGSSKSTSSSTLPTATASGKVGGVLDFLSWEGYDLPKIMHDWKKANGVNVKATYIASHDDIQAKLLSGGGKGIDLITYGPHYASYYRELGIVTQLDQSKIPNLAKLSPFFASAIDNAWINADGVRTGVPWTWGAIGILYDSNVVGKPSSYDVLFDPKFKGKVGFTDDPSGSYAAAANTLGLNVSKMTEDDFRKITDWLKKLAKQTKGIAPSNGDLTSKFVAGEIVYAFNGWAAIGSFAENAGKKGIKTAWPGRGGYTFVDAWAIPPHADNVETAYAWINETLDPAVNAKAAEFLVGGVVTEGAEQLLPEALRRLLPYNNLKAFVARVPLQNNPPVKSDQYVTFQKMLDAWDEVKVSAG